MQRHFAPVPKHSAYVIVAGLALSAALFMPSNAALAEEAETDAAVQDEPTLVVENLNGGGLASGVTDAASLDDLFTLDGTDDAFTVDDGADSSDAADDTTEEKANDSTINSKSGATVTTDADGNIVTDYTNVLPEVDTQDNKDTSAEKTDDVVSPEVKPDPADEIKNADNAEVKKYAGVFDAAYYLANNPDVKAVVGNDALKALQHFIKYGMNEGRRGNATFNVEAYYNGYQDLRNAYGTNLKSYYMHFVTYGQREGRNTLANALQDYRSSINGTNYSAIYDGAYYRANNADLDKAYTKYVRGYTLFDDTALLKHFINYGMKEGRSSSANFDVDSYYNTYQDLRAAYGTNLKSYYTHYIKYGQKEGRTTTGVTELQNYRTSLNGANYSAIYDGAYYRANNADLNNAYTKTVYGHKLFDDTALLNHFLKYGIKEGRKPIDASSFDVASYYYKYTDLRRAYGTDLARYFTHYAKYGISEGRTANDGLTDIAVYEVIYAGTNWSTVYDGSYYRTNNADLNKAYTKTVGVYVLFDDEALIAHFYRYGMNEARQAIASFDPWSYFLEYEDVRDAYHDSVRATYTHYMRYGKREGRHGTGCTTLHGRHWYTGYQNPSWAYQVWNKKVSVKGSGIFAFTSNIGINYNASRNDLIEAICNRAAQYVGNTPYIWDYACANGVGVDCAGLVLQCLYSVGMDFGDTYNPWDHYYKAGHDHYANDMWNDGKFYHVSTANRQRGDLACYNGHIAIYVGNNTIIEAYPGRGVRYNSVFAYSLKGFLRPIV